jgi:hypothetical protein
MMQHILTYLTVNGSNLINDPWNTTLEPFLNMFDHVFGVPETLFLMIVTVLSFGVYQLSDHHALYTSMFMVTTGSIIAVAGAFNGLPVLASLFTVFTAIGLASGFISIYLQRG